MTRRDFRGAVEGPRSGAAWLMSIVASLTLWITQQLPPWVIAIQCLAFTVSYATRSRPPAFRKNALWLNVFMLGITTVTIRSALEGNPAPISLAYFTSLAQGLQLLDARPRKSEFVLVALALFQVILASNLTDSVFFPPLLVVFLASVTWTLLVHTLAMEATEAGDPAAASRAITADLRRMTAWATLASLLLAAALFVALPRWKTSMLRGGLGSGIAMSGFSDRVVLGDVGRIRKDPRIVLRVESTGGESLAPVDSYWRGLAFDHFDGTRWSVSQSQNVAFRRPMSGMGRFGIELLPDTGARLSAQRILREPVDGGVLFTPAPAQRIEGPFQSLERDRNGGLYLAGRGDERVRYTIWSRPAARDAMRLRRDRAVPPLEPRAGGPRQAKRYLQLLDLDPRVAARAAEIVAGQTSDFDRALALRDALRREGRYSDTPPALDEQGRSPIEAFVLGDLEGHCEYFASAMVVLARSQGLPSRLVNGFAGGVPNAVGGFVEVSAADAHAWVEVHFEQAGWVRFDPTPPDLRLRAEQTLSLGERLAQLGSAIEIWWFQRVVDFDSADQIGAMRGLWARWRAGREASTGADTKASGDSGASGHDPLRALDPLLLFAAGSALIALRVLRRRPWGARHADVPASYRRAQRLLARRGLVREATTSAHDFAARVRDRLPEKGAAAFDTITRRYLAERFGARAAGDLRAELEVLEDAIDRMRLRNQSHVR